jgi:hypothetical protein
MKPGCTYRDKVNVIGHDLGEFVTVMFGPSFRERLWQTAQRFFVAIRLGLSDSRE